MKFFKFQNIDRIDTNSKIPKYKQVINNVLADIEQGILKRGERIPSINETSEEFLLSRDTVEKAYNELRTMGVIASVRGKGYYICHTYPEQKIRVLMLFNKLSAYKKNIYYSFMETLGEKAIVDIHVHHFSAKVLEELIEENLDKYNYFVVMPHFNNIDERKIIPPILSKIPKEKLVIIDKDIDYLKFDYPAVFQDFKRDIFDALELGLDLLKKYKKVKLVYPADYSFPVDIIEGFKLFCRRNSFEFCVIETIFDEPINRKEAYIVIQETDLVDLIKQVRNQNLIIGQDVGLISYNETPLKEILLDGITVISTDFERMGQLTAELILNKQKTKIKNPFKLIRRNSL